MHLESIQATLLSTTVTLSILALCFTYNGIISFMPKMRAARLAGFDLNKKGGPLESKDPVPESLGLISGVFFIFVTIILNLCFPALNLNSVSLTIALMLFLGFADDVLNFRWLIKIIVPFVCMIPLISSYAGSSHLIVPFLGRINLSYSIYAIIGALIIFSINAINIHAGINGIEVGQSLVIGSFLLFLVLRGETTDANISAAVLLLVFLAVSLPLFYFNKYPSRVFVGDTFCYFAGAVLGAAAILSNRIIEYSFLLLPQILNFVLSIPQLLNFIPCPRHRLPRYDPADNKLHAVWPNHYTLINLYLKLFGAEYEGILTTKMMLLQATFCLIGLQFAKYITLE